MSTFLNRSERAFLFDAEVPDLLSLEKIGLRSEDEYDGEICPEKTALKYIESISKCFDGDTYLVTASHDVGPTKKLRSKKGVLWKEKQLRSLEIYNDEVEVENGITRLVSLVKLRDFDYHESESIVLGWRFSFILI